MQLHFSVFVKIFVFPYRFSLDKFSLTQTISSRREILDGSVNFSVGIISLFCLDAVFMKEIFRPVFRSRFVVMHRTNFLLFVIKNRRRLFGSRIQFSALIAVARFEFSFFVPFKRKPFFHSVFVVNFSFTLAAGMVKK